jgi:hypothetical protein
MKLFPAGAAALAALCLASFQGRSLAQAAPPPPNPPQPAQSAPNQSAQPGRQPSATQAPATQAPAKGQVIFSRSIDEEGQVVNQVAPAVVVSPTSAVPAPTVEDAERQAVTYTDLDLDVHLRPAEQHIAVRALLTVRNDGKTPLDRIPLQISSALTWERIRANDRDVTFTVTTLNSDTDHTGQLHEALIQLESPLEPPLAPGATTHLDVTYSGDIPVDAKRLIAIGTPEDVALHSDWDQIGTDFTGLRGFGNVVWYPVSSVPAVLGVSEEAATLDWQKAGGANVDSARVFDEIGEHKLRLSGARFRLQLAVEFPAGQAPTIAVINGHNAALTVTDAVPGQEVPGVATASFGPIPLGFAAPSLFVAIRKPHPGTAANFFTQPDDEPSVDAWTTAAAAVTPFLEGWLGERPRSQLAVLDLPDAHDAPFETGTLLATPIRPAPQDQLQGVLAHSLTHAFLRASLQSSAPSPPAWLDEGVAAFMATLWTEKQQGRQQALGTLESARPALALAEPESPGESVGQPLAAATSPLYYRTKAAYVLWMLRDLAGEPPLSAALRAYNSGSADPSAAGSRSSFEKLIEQAGTRRDLGWFFADWVDADKGLPDLSIESVFPSAATADSSLVTVNLANNGYASAEVPVTVRSQSTSITQRVLIPARGKVSQRILIQGKPTQVQLNDGAVPETEASVHVKDLEDAN